MQLAAQRFEQLVLDIADEVVGRLPPELRTEAETVMLDVADWPSEAQDPDGDGLLGLYEGVPLVERGPDDVLLAPDRITLFRGPLLELCADEAELRREIRVTLVHELGHFFGYDEDELERRGWA